MASLALTNAQMNLQKAFTNQQYVHTMTKIEMLQSISEMKVCDYKHIANTYKTVGHGVSSILYSLEYLNEKPPLCVA